jgi:hypothetical protein
LSSNVSILTNCCLTKTVRLCFRCCAPPLTSRADTIIAIIVWHGVAFLIGRESCTGVLGAPQEADKIGGLTDCQDGGNRRDTDAGVKLYSPQNERREQCQHDTRCYSGPSQAPFAKHESGNSGQRR